MTFADSLADGQERDGEHGFDGEHGPAGPRRPPVAGAHGLAAGEQGEAEGPRPDAGEHGLAALPLDGEQGPCTALPRPRPGAQGLPGPHGLRAACAICIGLAATGVGAAAVTATAAATVDRLPASSADLIRRVCITRSPI
jgi:hypothetical protein